MDRSTVIRNKDQTLSGRFIGQFLEPAQPSFGAKLELQGTFEVRNHSPALDQHISFPSQRHATLKLRVLRTCLPGDKPYAASHSSTTPTIEISVIHESTVRAEMDVTTGVAARQKRVTNDFRSV
jgi:hypothetical protein